MYIFASLLTVTCHRTVLISSIFTRMSRYVEYADLFFNVTRRSYQPDSNSLVLESFQPFSVRISLLTFSVKFSGTLDSIKLKNHFLHSGHPLVYKCNTLQLGFSSSNELGQEREHKAPATAYVQQGVLGQHNLFWCVATAASK